MIRAELPEDGIFVDEVTQIGFAARLGDGRREPRFFDLAFQGPVVRLALAAGELALKTGNFSGAVREELNRAENAGLKTFLIRVYQIAFRIQRFFQGIGEGFSAAIEAAAPVFEAFVGALTRLGQALGLTDGGERHEVQEVARQLGAGAGADRPEVADEGGEVAEHGTAQLDRVRLATDHHGEGAGVGAHGTAGDR